MSSLLPSLADLKKESDRVDSEMSLDGFPKEELKRSRTISTEEKETDKDMKDEVKTPIICFDCGKEIPDASHKACLHCGYYRPQPGETFDLSKVRWKLPETIHQRIQVRSVDTPHELPFPGGFGSGLQINTPESNEWVLNHLPIKQEEKKQLVADIAQEHSIERVKELQQARDEKQKLTKSQLVKEGWRRRRNKDREDIDMHKSSVKDLSKSSLVVRHVNKEPTLFTPHPVEPTSMETSSTSV